MSTYMYSDVFDQYFKNAENPSLKEFISNHKKLIIDNYERNQKLKDVWTTRFAKAHENNYRHLPKKDKPKPDLDGVDWYEITIDILSKENLSPDCKPKPTSHSSTLPSSSSSTTTTTTTTTNSSKVTVTEIFLKEFTTVYEKMDDECKWTLSSGKVVEDILYSYGSKCCYEDVSHSFILDMACDDLMKNFTKEEIEELEGKSPHPLPEIPEQLLNYLNDFIGLTTIEALETRVRKRYFDFHEEFYLDWAQNSIQNVLRLFHAKYFPLTTQTEADIIRRVYTFIDTIFDDKHNLDVRTGEMESSASSDRRNLLRQPDERKKHGHKSDMLFISFKGEVGCTEVGKKDAGDNGTKEQNALGLKLPKMLKDQMWKLVHLFPENRSDLVTVGLVMMGLKLRAVILDNPSTYVCRVKKTKPYFFPTTVETIASDLGMLLGVTSQVKQLICSTVKIIETPKPITSSGYETTTNKPELLLPCPMSPKPKKATKNI